MRRLAVAAAVALVSACHGGGAQLGRLPSEAALGPGALATAAPEAGATAGGAGSEDGMPRLAVALDDRRLAAARAASDARDLSTAAREVDVARATAALDAAQACAWDYLAGRLHYDAGEMTEAAAAFERVLSPHDGGGPCPLAAYASLRDAEALVRSGKPDEALPRALAVGDATALPDEARLAIADAQSGKGDRASAVVLWRRHLAANPSGLRWADVSMLLATTLLDGGDGPAEAHAQEALDLATRVLAEAPWVDDKGDVSTLRSRAAALLPAKAAPPLTVDERARQAQAWLDFSKPKRATEVAQALLDAIRPGDKAHADAACKAAIARAHAVPHGKNDDAADAWGTAIARCEGSDTLVTALYQGAKASAAARRRAEARARFERVEKLFPSHRLADDARFRSAMLAYDQGDEAKYLSLLASIPDVYPDGDMKIEALFRVALARLGKRDLDGARAALDRLLSSSPDEKQAPRAAYFRARVAQLAGETDDAKARYGEIVGSQPLSYYMLLAYERLRGIDDGAAHAAMEAAVAREPAAPFFTREHPELTSPPLDRFARLLEVGEIDAARRELSAAGMTGESADPEVLWAIAWMYERAGAPDIGHAFSRGRLVDYRAHWPAGRWRLAWQIAFPRPWDAMVLRESETAGIPLPLTWAIMREESAFDPEAHSPANAIGLMQLIASTARLLTRGTALSADDASLRKPDVSIALGTRLLGQLRVSFATNPALAIAAYNAGAGAVRRWLGDRGADDFDLFVERIPFDETRAYLKRVLGSQAAYAYLYAPKALDELLALPLRASGQEMVAAP